MTPAFHRRRGTDQKSKGNGVVVETSDNSYNTGRLANRRVSLQSTFILRVMAQGAGSMLCDLAAEPNLQGVRQMSSSPAYPRHVVGEG